jgi:ribosomal protein S18 acetylase RimI-like enzyme
LKIRDYQPGDFEALYELDHASFSEEIAWSRLELLYYVRAKKCRTLIFEHRKKILGFVIGSVEPKKLGHIITIEVVATKQRQQIGSKLLAAIESFLWEKGVQAIFLETAVDDGGARGFYEKHGYFVTDRFEQYYTETLDAFVMMKASKR